MIITTYGTRGSVPVAGAKYVKYGGNTTCLRVDSTCLPANTWLVIDAGTGILPLVYEGLAAAVQTVFLLFTHYHHDHTQGLLLAPWTYMKNVQMHLYGPLESQVGPKQMLEHVMRPPFHPVSSGEVSSHMSFKGIEHPAEEVFIIHPEGGLKLCPLAELEKANHNGSSGQISFPRGVKYSLNECLVVIMYRSNHPERTISYRFEERSTGKVFVLLTDHENQAASPRALRDHLKGADLLVMDSQYAQKQYEERTAGFGHGTPGYCVGVANEVGAKILGLTHHDPASTDEKVDAILKEAEEEGTQLGFTGQIKACRDFEAITLN